MVMLFADCLEYLLLDTVGLVTYACAIYGYNLSNITTCLNLTTYNAKNYKFYCEYVTCHALLREPFINSFVMYNNVCSAKLNLTDSFPV